MTADGRVKALCLKDSEIKSGSRDRRRAVFLFGRPLRCAAVLSIRRRLDPEIIELFSGPEL